MVLKTSHNTVNGKQVGYTVEISTTSHAVTQLSAEEYAQIVQEQDGFEPNFRTAADLEDNVEFAKLDDGRRIYRETI